MSMQIWRLAITFLVWMIAVQVTASELPKYPKVLFLSIVIIGAVAIVAAVDVLKKPHD